MSSGANASATFFHRLLFADLLDLAASDSKRQLPAQMRQGQIAAFGVEKVKEEAARPPVLDPVRWVVMGEAYVEVAKLVEDRGSLDERMTMYRIHVTSGDLDCCVPRLRINALTIIGNARLTQQATEVDLDRAEHSELEVQQGDNLAAPEGVHECKIAMVDGLLNHGCSTE